MRLARDPCGALLLALALAGCSASALDEVARADFEGSGVGVDRRPSFACAGQGRIEVETQSPEGWLSVTLTDPTGNEAFGQVFDGGPDPGRASGTFGFRGAGGLGWTLAVERHDHAQSGRFDGSYVVRVLC